MREVFLAELIEGDAGGEAELCLVPAGGDARKYTAEGGGCDAGARGWLAGGSTLGGGVRRSGGETDGRWVCLPRIGPR